MLVPVRAMHMAVGNFFSGGCPHGGDLAAELQCLARQGVVAVQMHFRALDLPFNAFLVGYPNWRIVALTRKPSLI